ncbi:PREDICTED: uncharacterized protein FLJ43738-like [Elephantulus edwardii]|uniref:uncharacterized protein FLJ43738-like n=1 Tax=Elephantulus edwardii TaxID=28737 RepID=UPI0003F0C571|nr:PREDICTED: uncharacterized protein FLJ43738-like [Elephantulus edwardii]
MNEEQKQELNPMTIKIKCASYLPSEPVSFSELERLCAPVYCRYQFHNTPVHETEGQPHGSHVYFQDINVIFLGTLCPIDLKTYLEGPPMVVEVHDRDLKSEEYTWKPTLFGEDPLDTYIGLPTLISHTQTEKNPFESHKKIRFPYGVAQVSFADLLLGQTSLNLYVPIHGCKSKLTGQSQTSKSRNLGSQFPTDSLQHKPMPMGNYLWADSHLKLRVELAVPLQLGAEVPEPHLIGTQFGLIIFVFNCRKKTFLLQSLLQDIAMINAKALDLYSYPLRDIQQILSVFKVHEKVQDQQDMDILTGFHLLDGRIHLLILEGLVDQGLKQLWELHQNRALESEDGKYKVLYDSEIWFHHRLYADLESILYNVHLFKPLSLLMKNPQLYIRNRVPPETLKALFSLHYICQDSTELSEVVARHLLPSSAVMKCLNQEFGIPVSQEDLSDENLPTLPSQPAPKLKQSPRQKPSLPSEIQTHQEPRKRFTYSQDYLSAMVEPYDWEAEQKKAEKKSRQAWLTASGFHVPGRGDSQYLSLPPVCFTEELKEVHRQKQVTREPAHKDQLPSNTLSLLPDNKPEPGLDHRGWGWEQRHVDFDLFQKPPPSLSPPLSGVLKAEMDELRDGLRDGLKQKEVRNLERFLSPRFAASLQNRPETF